MYHSLFIVSTFLFGLFHTADRPGDHAIYLSVVEIVHDGGDSMIIKIKVFSDDLEDALMNAFRKRVTLSDPSTCRVNKNEITGYFSGHFKCTINQNELKMRLNRCETAGDATWFYFTADCPTAWTEVKISADYLLELFPTQSNVVSISHGKKKHFLRLTQSKTSEVITF